MTSRRIDPQGVALILVLAFLALLSVLILAFFSTVSGELQSARLETHGVTSRQLADSATQMVMGQIREATSQAGQTAWASQPGAIRTYGTGTAASGDALAVYKLYSSDNMVVGKSQLNSTTGGWHAASDVPVDWAAQKALFTDLNAPVLVEDPLGTIAGSTRCTAVYPIVDPAAQKASPSASLSGPAGVEGFALNQPPGYSGSNPPPPEYNPTQHPASPAATSNPAPMPVRWIYVLGDGTLSAPTGVDATGTIANWATANAGLRPTPTNPIVGRIAFWTDDESAKININTAAGDERLSVAKPEPGSFWDMPRVNNNFDQQLAYKQVAQFEFQRYPGHPATISLNPVFSDPQLTRNDLTALTPRVARSDAAAGGSAGGTRDTYKDTAPMPRKTERLYTSVDELFFNMPGSPFPGLRDGNKLSTLPLAQEPPHGTLEKARFFLTAHSRVPEVNLFSRPRVSIWPIHEIDSPKTRSASDQLLAFCARIGGQRYHFTHGGADWTNNNLTADYANIPRNQQLYTYLQNLTGRNVPGFNGSATGFVAKYGAPERDQILTEIYDYIRSTDLRDDQLIAEGGKAYTPSKGVMGSGQVLPIIIGKTKGFGRFATISEASLVFFATKVEMVPSGSKQVEKVTKMRAVLIFETFSPAQGHAGLYSDYTHVVRGLDKLSVRVGSRTLNLNMPAVAENKVVKLSGMHSRIWSGTEGVAQQFLTVSGVKKVPGLDPAANYPFVSQTDIDLGTNPTETTMLLDEGSIDVDIDWKKTPNDAAPQVAQTLHFKFPATNAANAWPQPRKPADLLCLDFNYRIVGVNYHNIPEKGQEQAYDLLINQYDTVRSLEAGGVPEGDLRLVAALKDVPPEYFTPHKDYQTNKNAAHSLRLGLGNTYAGATLGKLVAAATYSGIFTPDTPSSVTTGALLHGRGGAVGFPGDWDTGMAAYMDGPYINKPDEGTTSKGTNTTSELPYYTNTDEFDAQALFSPNRQVSSPVMFGSLSTGVVRKLPWQTLLFRPDPSNQHPGTAAPKDALLLDLFNMPIVEPYAISEPFSTAGKVNMNYQIAPFSYIRRETALHGALQSTWTMGIPTADSKIYKGNAGPKNYRFRLDRTETLRQFQDRFDQDRIFVSPSEVCDLELVPEGQKVSGMPAYWAQNLLTGDNVREMPYTHLYPLLTTKSNIYTVHLRVQSLAKSKNAKVDEWDETRDQMASEYRGSSIIERYVDPDDPLLPDFAALSLDDPKGDLDQYYRARVIETKQFAP